MDSETFIQITAGDLTDKFSLENEIIFELAPGAFKAVDNIGHIKVNLDDGIVSVKILTDVDGTLDGHPLKNGSIYFLEDDSNLIINECHIKRIDSKAKTPNQDFEVSLSNQGTVTSIDVGKLLAKVNENKSNKPTASVATPVKKVRKKKKPVVRNKIESGPKMKKGRAKKAKPAATPLELEASRKEKLLLKEHRVGFVLRFFAIIFNIYLAINLFTFFDFAVFNSLTQNLTSLLSSLMPKNLGLSVPIDLIKTLLILLSIELISRVLFAVSLPQFLCGITVNGNFATKRVKALIKYPLDMLSIFFPLFDFPVLLGKSSLKEALTKGELIYRVKYFKALSVVIMPALLVATLLSPRLLQGDVDFTPNLPAHYSFKKKTSIELNEAYLDLEVYENFYFDGLTDKQQSAFIFINKKNSAILGFKQVRNFSFKSLEPITKKIPFFKTNYPFLSNYFETNESNKKVKEDVLKLFKTGEILSTLNYLDILNLDIFAAKEAYLLFKKFVLPTHKYGSATGLYRLYERPGTRLAVVIGDQSIKTYQLEYSQQMVPAIHKLIFLHESGSGKKTPFNTLLASKTLNSNQYLEDQRLIRDLVKGQGGEKEKKLYQDFLRGLILKGQSTKDPEIKMISSQLEELLNSLN